MVKRRGEKIGIALGSGAARGMAHIGVLRALTEAGVKPDVVCGTSIGAVVGAAYAAGRLDAFESWIRGLDRRRVATYFDVSFRGGIIKARKVFEAMADHVPDCAIEELDTAFACVATDLASGREVWFRDGGLYEALRASTALPGLIAPVRSQHRWLIDGGLVNPVPVSLCRALGADVIIAVDLNTNLVGRRIQGRLEEPVETAELAADRIDERGMSNVRAMLQDLATELRERITGDDAAEREDPPTIYEVIANSVNIMQVRISRSRMSGEPPDLLIVPRLVDFGLLDFDRAGAAIDEGARAAKKALAGSSYVVDALSRGL